MIMLIFVLCVVTGAYAQSGPSVNTSQGVVIGLYDNDIMSFYGIHYAGHVTAENRFKSPTPPPLYPGDFYAVDDSVVCAQPTPRGLIGVEDCLVLNIHTKNLTSSQPVMVWIEGENYETTIPKSYTYENLINEDIVFVTVNYRLSIFGFLCLGVEEAPGNAGLKDVVQALKWIQENILSFGGNPDNVVLMGHGSGAAMVDLITLSPMGVGLVHKAIIISGSALSPWTVSYDSFNYARAVGANLGYTDISNSELAISLSNTDIQTLSRALTNFEFYNNTPLFAPCVEDFYLNPDDTFLATAPINIIRSGNFSHIPIIAGYVDKEGSMRATQAFQGWIDQMRSDFIEFLQPDLQFETISDKEMLAQNISNFYFTSSINVDDFFKYQGDTLVLVSMIRGAKERASRSTASVRLFEFAYRRLVDPDWIYPDVPLNGVRHGGILSFIFTPCNETEISKGDGMARKRLITRFTEFVNTGSQNLANHTTWDPITSTRVNMLHITGEEKIPGLTVLGETAATNLNRDRTDFWDKIYDSYYRVPTSIHQASSASQLLSFSVILYSSLLFIGCL